MQLIDICTIAIELFGAAYFLIALAAHLRHCWQHPPAKSAPVAVEPTALLLLPPAAHPFEMSLEKMPELEPIAALHQPAAEVEPPQVSPLGENNAPELLDVGTLLDAIDIPAPSPFAQMSIRELKRIASDRKLPRYSSLKKGELIAALNS